MICDSVIKKSLNRQSLNHSILFAVLLIILDHLGDNHVQVTRNHVIGKFINRSVCIRVNRTTIEDSSIPAVC